MVIFYDGLNAMTNSIKRAFIHVAHKNGILELAHKLIQMNWTIFSTNETAVFFKENNIPCALLNNEKEFDAVIVNLPHFKNKLEDLDIDFHAFIRASAKNYTKVAVIVDPSDYPSFLKEPNTPQFRFSLAQKAFSYIASYDATISNYLSTMNNRFPSHYHATYYKKYELLPEKNAQSALYTETSDTHKSLQKNWFGLGAAALPQSTLIQGNSLSFNDMIDADNAWKTLKALDTNEPACVIVKGDVICDSAIRYTIIEAYQSASQHISNIFDGVIAINKTCDVALAQHILKTSFTGTIFAPQIAPEAITMFKQKPLLRLLVCPYFQPVSQSSVCEDFVLKQVRGGLLMQIPNKD